jgi:hypothetical protein
MFKDLTEEEIEQFKEYARENLPGRANWSLLHPVCRAVWWELACQHDGLDPQTSIILFSDDNPYFAEEHHED